MIAPILVYLKVSYVKGNRKPISCNSKKIYKHFRKLTVEEQMTPIREIEWEIAKGKVLENQKNAELATALGISHENNVSRIYSRFIEKIEQTEKDLLQAIELGLYTPVWLDIRKKTESQKSLLKYLKSELENAFTD